MTTDGLWQRCILQNAPVGRRTRGSWVIRRSRLEPLSLLPDSALARLLVIDKLLGFEEELLVNDLDIAIDNEIPSDLEDEDIGDEEDIQDEGAVGVAMEQPAQDQNLLRLHRWDTKLLFSQADGLENENSNR